MIVTTVVVLWTLSRREPDRAAARATPAAVEDIVPVEARPSQIVWGDTAAKVVLIEFSDFECPFCGKYDAETYSRLESEFVETGMVSYMFRNMPVDALHLSAFKAAEAAACAHEQGRFLPMRRSLFAAQNNLAIADLLARGHELGLNSDQFANCLNGFMSGRVKDDQAEAARLGITATPTFLLGSRAADGRIRAFRRINGAQPYGVFEKALKAALVELSD